jgi:hypothetical protein
MSASVQEITESNNWKARTLIIGTVVGAAVGVLSAYLLIQRADREKQVLSVSAGEGVRLGLLVFGLLRQVTTLGEDK